MSRSEFEFSVIFCKEWTLQGNLKPYTIAIVPLSNDWNDFGFRTAVQIFVQGNPNAEMHNFAAMLGFISGGRDDQPTGIALVEKQLEEKPPVAVPGDLPVFFTMLRDIGQYREIVRLLTPEGAAQVLTAINDIVFANERRPTLDWLPTAENSKLFTYSFMRTSEAHFAHRNAASVLNGLEFETFGEISNALCVHFQLGGRPNPHSLTFEFDSNAKLPKRISIIIGQNGMGKSQALTRMARAAIYDDRNVFFDKDTGGRARINRLFVFVPTNDMKDSYPNDRRKRSNIHYSRVSLSRPPQRSSTPGLSDTIVQLARSSEHILGETRWNIFLNALEALNGWRQLALLDKTEATVPLHLVKRRGEQESLDVFGSIDLQRDPVRYISGKAFPLSSGEISYLRFVAQTSLMIENGSLLLFDEPETHLHPYFISQFVSVLNSLLQKTNSLAIIATHSVYFVREVFEDQVVVLRNGPDNEIRTEPLRLKTFGADIGAISYFVFGQDEPSDLAVDVGQKVLGENKQWHEILEAYKHELSPDLLGLIRDKLEHPEGKNGLE